MANDLTGAARKARQRDWDTSCSLLEEFEATHGRLPEYQETMPDGYPIGKWRTVNRTRYAPTVEQEAARQAQWCSEATTPAQRARVERHLARHGERRARLEAVPGWSWVGRVDRTSSEWVGLLKDFVAENNGRLPSKDCVYRGARLGEWVKHRRYKYAAGLLTDDEIAELEAVPQWRWVVRELKSFEDACVMVEQWVAVHGTMPDRNVVVEGYALGKFVNNQRARRETLLPERIARLETIPGWWWSALAK